MEEKGSQHKEHTVEKRVRLKDLLKEGIKKTTVKTENKPVKSNLDLLLEQHKSFSYSAPIKIQQRKLSSKTRSSKESNNAIKKPDNDQHNNVKYSHNEVTTKNHTSQSENQTHNTSDQLISIKENYSIEDFLHNKITLCDANGNKMPQQDECNKENRTIYSVSGTVSVSSETGQLIIEKSTEEHEDVIATVEDKAIEQNLVENCTEENIEYVNDNTFIHDILTTWSGESKVRLGAIKIIGQELKKMILSFGTNMQAVNTQLSLLSGLAKENDSWMYEIAQTSGTFSIDGYNVSLLEAIDYINDTVDDATNKTTYIKEQVKSDISNLENTNKDLVNIESLIQSVHKLNKKTNLLALNATVESSRLGELGKGIAIVADEIRTCVNEVTTITEEVSNKINNASTQVTNCTQSLNNLSDSNTSNAPRFKTQIDKMMSGIKRNGELISTQIQDNLHTSKHTCNNIDELIDNIRHTDETYKQINNITNLLLSTADDVRASTNKAQEELGISPTQNNVEIEVIKNLISRMEPGPLMTEFIKFLIAEEYIDSTHDVTETA